MLTKVIPVTTRITEENLSFDKVSYIWYGRIGFKEHSDSQKFSYEDSIVTDNCMGAYEEKTWSVMLQR
jgi:hypothetical protein